jgi:magnesium-protoporphyrin IX monomethyl ester (oxidative) cyclase
MSSVILINPPQIFTKTQVIAGVTPPLGPAYLAAVLDQAGYKVKIIDGLGEQPEQLTSYNDFVLRGLTFSEIIRLIPRGVDLIGISNLYTFAFPMVSELAREIKSRFPTVPIVLGGAHVSSLPEVTLADPSVDFVIVSEGENSLLELCNALNGNGDVSDIDGFGFKRNSKIYMNPKKDFIADLDSIPFPKRDLLPMENYLKAAEPHGAVRGRWTTMIATRGCPFSCSFCNTPLIWQRRWRARKPSRVVDEMEDLARIYRINDFHFEDENMSTSKKWITQFCNELIDRRLAVGWQLSNGARAETLSKEILSKMKTSGLTNLGVAPESGSERIRREVIRKHLDTEAVEEAVVNASNLGITITSYFVIGFPDETEAEINQTIRFARKLARLGLDECSVNTLQLVPGCELFYELEKEGRITADNDFFKNLGQMGDLAGVKTWSDTLSDRKLSRLKRKAYLQFYLTSFLYHPSKALRLIKNLITSVQETKSERVFHSLLRHNNPF